MRQRLSPSPEVSLKSKRQPRRQESGPADLAAVLAESQRLAASQRLEETERLLARYPDHLECVFRRGAVLMTLERWPEAETCFRKTLTAMPTHFDSAVALAGALMEQGKAAEALPLLDAALRAKPDTGRLHYFRAIALEEIGRAEEGQRELAHARNLLIAPAERRNLVPWEVYVQISRRCNLRCAMCGHEVWKTNTGFMDMAVFDRVLAECAANNIKKINILAGQGEPMLHPQVFEMLEKAIAGGFEVHIVTNGTPLTPERIQRFAKLGLASIQFSFAGWDKESYENTYVGAKFERTLANLLQMQEATKGTATDFFVKAVVTDDNWAEIARRTRAFLTGQGVEKVFTVVANNFGGNVQGGLFNDRHEVWSLKNLEHQRRMPCRVFLTAIGVFCDGTVTACGCYDSNALLKIGDIMEQSLIDIRHGDSFRRILEAFRQGDVSEVPMCSKCDDCFG